MDLIWSERAGVTVVGPNTTAFLAPLRPGALGRRRAPAPGRRAAAVRRAGAGAARRPRCRRASCGATPGARLEEASRRATATTSAPACWSRSSRRARRRPSPTRSSAPPPARLDARAGGATSRASWPSASATCAGSSSAEVGYGPKRLGRVLRLRRALARVRARRRAGRGGVRGRLRRPGPLHQRVPRAGRRRRLAVFSKTRAAERANIAAMTETARLGWVIVYVPDVEAAIAFYEQSFGLERSFVARGRGLRRARHRRRPSSRSRPRRWATPTSRAASGARAPTGPSTSSSRSSSTTPRRPSRAPSRTARPRSRSPSSKPWGQIVAYVRDPFGTLVELATHRLAPQP